MELKYKPKPKQKVVIGGVELEIKPLPVKLLPLSLQLSTIAKKGITEDMAKNLVDYVSAVIKEQYPETPNETISDLISDNLMEVVSKLHIFLGQTDEEREKEIKTKEKLEAEGIN